MKWIATIGLILNVIGSVIFIIDSNRLSGVLSSMMTHMARGFGLWDQEPINEEQQNELNNKIIASKKLAYWGYALFLTGFILQLIALWWK